MSRLTNYGKATIHTMIGVVVLGSWLSGVAQCQTSAVVYAWTNIAGQPGGSGWGDGTGSGARFNQPTGVAVDSEGNVFVADTDDNTIRKVTPAGLVTTLAGRAGTQGSADGTGSAARFDSPTGVAVDTNGNVYVADANNHTIRKVTAAGDVTTLAGSAGFAGSADGTGSAARFDGPTGVTVDSVDNVFVADRYNHTIRKVTPAGVVTTLAGNASITDPGGQSVGGYADGTGSAARFNQPTGVTVDSADNVFVADYNNNTIRKVTPVGTNWVVTTLAGSTNSYGSADGTGSAARFYNPQGVTVDTNGNVFVADSGNQTIRQVTAAGVVTTLAGNVGVIGSADGTGTAANFSDPTGVAVDSAGNVYVADQDNQTIREVMADGVVTTLAGSAGVICSADGTGTAARFSYPTGVAVDSASNLYVADSDDDTIRKLTLVGTNWVVTTLAGSAVNYGSADGTGSAARFSGPSGVSVNTNGNVFVADFYNDTVREATLVGTNWVVTTLAGSVGNSGSADGTGGVARFDFPSGVAVDSAGNVFVADYGNDTIRKMTLVGTNWVVTTVAGSALVMGSVDGTGSAARFSTPYDVAVDTTGDVFVADYNNNTIRKVTPVGTNWVVTTLAGSAGVWGSADGMGSAASFSDPSGVAVDSAGNVFVTDRYNHTIREVTPTGVVTTIGGVAGVAGWSDGIGSAAKFAYPEGIAVDSAGNLYVADTVNNRISKGTPSLTITTPSPLPSGTVGTAYNQTLTAIGGAPPYTWSVVSNSLPPGLMLVASSGAITGTPTVATTVNFTVRVTRADSVFSEQGFSLTISPCTYILSASLASFPAKGGNSNVTVSTTAGCSWTVNASDSWITITSPVNGVGNGTIAYSVSPNASIAGRTSTFTIAGQTFTVTQIGNVAPQVSIAPVPPITLPVTTANLTATVTDDGAPYGTISVTWSKVSGLGTVSFGTANAINTSATFSTNGTYVLQLLASDGALSSSNDVTVIVNTRPTITSPPAVSNAVAAIDGVPVVMPMESFTFTAAATDADGNALSCFWSFGDGVNSVDCQPSHVFSNCGPHTVTYVVTDGISPVTNSLVVAVACPFEVLPKPLSLTMKVNFVTNKLDTASLKGVIDLPVGVATTNIAVQLSIGSVDVPFSLDRKGRGLNGYSSLKLTRKGKPVLSNQLWQVTGSFRGDFDAVWVGDGLANTNVLNQSITVPVLLLLDSDPPESFYIEKPLLYKGKAGKSGSAK